MNTQSTNTPYWIIVSDEGTSTKPKKHLSYQSAYDESIRLSKLKPGITFAIYQFVGSAFTPKPVEQKTTFTAYQQQLSYSVAGFRMW